jgi:hypothetical protein
MDSATTFLGIVDVCVECRFKEVFDAIRQLMSPAVTKKKRSIGFAPWKEK